MAWAGYWDLRRGDHPGLAKSLERELETLPLFPSAEEWQAVGGLDLPVRASGQAHHVVEDAGYRHASGGVDEYPLAPLFVRDLAGRVIHTGLVPLPRVPQEPLFPAGCMDIPATVQGAGLVENAVFTLFRCLEVGGAGPSKLAGQPEYVLRAAYAKPSGWSYKIRPDTFYQDGWRLPQVARLFAKPVAGAEVAAEAFMSAWQMRPAEQDYESFYDQRNGAQWYEQLFLKGVTVIPTLEGYNGRYHVAEDYSITDVDPGRAVEGLHQVLERVDSDLPAGTILSVARPGYVTQTRVEKAQVVVSNGVGFGGSGGPKPLLPNLHWPHPRVSPQWGKVWLPTHPSHFEEPALWDWDETGHFMQMSGPLWDPLHYVYASVPAIVRATRKRVEGNAGAFQLPESLRARFHPVVTQTWYDTVNERTMQERALDIAHPLAGSVLDQVPLMKPVATVGYHFLPPGLEYELDPAVFPELHPAVRVGPCPEELRTRLAGMAQPEEKADFRALQVVVSEPLRQTVLAAGAGDEPKWDYAVPEKMPYACNDIAREQPFFRGMPVFLPELPASHLLINVKRLFASRVYRQALQRQGATLAAALFRFREDGLSWRRLRYRLFAKYPAVWMEAWIKGVPLVLAEKWVAERTPEEHDKIRALRAQALGVEHRPHKVMPARGAVGLRSGAKAARVKKA